jgi:hypothetical protein
MLGSRIAILRGAVVGGEIDVGDGATLGVDPSFLRSSVVAEDDRAQIDERNEKIRAYFRSQKERPPVSPDSKVPESKVPENSSLPSPLTFKFQGARVHLSSLALVNFHINVIIGETDEYGGKIEMCHSENLTVHGKLLQHSSVRAIGIKSWVLVAKNATADGSIRVENAARLYVESDGKLSENSRVTATGSKSEIVIEHGAEVRGGGQIEVDDSATLRVWGQLLQNSRVKAAGSGTTVGLSWQGTGDGVIDIKDGAKLVVYGKLLANANVGGIGSGTTIFIHEDAHVQPGGQISIATSDSHPSSEGANHDKMVAERVAGKIVVRGKLLQNSRVVAAGFLSDVELKGFSDGNIEIQGGARLHVNTDLLHNARVTATGSESKILIEKLVTVREWAKIKVDNSANINVRGRLRQNSTVEATGSGTEVEVEATGEVDGVIQIKDSAKLHVFGKLFQNASLIVTGSGSEIIINKGVAMIAGKIDVGDGATLRIDQSLLNDTAAEAAAAKAFIEKRNGEVRDYLRNQRERSTGSEVPETSGLPADHMFKWEQALVHLHGSATVEFCIVSDAQKSVSAKQIENTDSAKKSVFGTEAEVKFDNKSGMNNESVRNSGSHSGNVDDESHASKNENHGQPENHGHSKVHNPNLPENLAFGAAAPENPGIPVRHQTNHAFPRRHFSWKGFVPHSQQSSNKNSENRILIIY